VTLYYPLNSPPVSRQNGAPVQTPARQLLLRALDELATPEIGDFRNGNAPRTGDLRDYRIVPDAKLRQKLAAAGLIEIVQSPGPGNWKKDKPANIARVYANFNSPSRGGAARAPRHVHKQATAELLPAAILHDLRQKWEAYYLDTRPERQRRHEQHAQSVSPEAIAKRATELLGQARREERPLTSRDAMLQATDELTSDFETTLRQKYGDLVVEILGIPDATDRRPRA
jgi:hypothetical protein